MNVRLLLASLWSDERGQDLIEYALLTSAIALASVAAFGQIQSAIAATYSSWTTATNAIAEPPDP